MYRCVFNCHAFHAIALSQEQHLYVVGSLEESLVFSGLRHNPADIEATVERSSARVCTRRGRGKGEEETMKLKLTAAHWPMHPFGPHLIDLIPIIYKFPSFRLQLEALWRSSLLARLSSL